MRFNRKQAIGIALIAISAVLGLYFFGLLTLPQPVSTAKTFPSASDHLSYPIPELKEVSVSGQYNTEGYVVFVSDCPPCPIGARCSPCPPNHVVISPSASIPDSARYPADGLVIVWNDGAGEKNRGQFQLGKKCRFSVSVDPLTDATIGGQKAGVRLIGYDLME